MHIPKNAGSAIKPWCHEYKINRIPHNLYNRSVNTLRDWRRAHRKKQHSLFAFCVCRNPYDRVVSAYYYLMNHSSDHTDLYDREVYLMQYEDFEDFVKRGLRKVSMYQSHFKPQVFWIMNDFKEPEIERVLRFEKLDDDFSDMLKDLNLPDYKLEVVNKSKHSDWKNYYSEETKAIVRDIYEQDFKYFGYAG